MTYLIGQLLNDILSKMLKVIRMLKTNDLNNMTNKKNNCKLVNTLNINFFCAKNSNSS